MMLMQRCTCLTLLVLLLRTWSAEAFAPATTNSRKSSGLQLYRESVSSASSSSSSSAPLPKAKKSPSFMGAGGSSSPSSTERGMVSFVSDEMAALTNDALASRTATSNAGFAYAQQGGLATAGTNAVAPTIDWSEWIPVLSASLLITGNTFGAGSLVLPTLVQGPGLAAASTVFGGAYLINLLSGFVIAEVAIRQKEASGTEVPSSFKELVQENLQSPTLATLISSVSFVVNALVFSFDLSRVGLVTNQLTAGAVDASTVSLVWGSLLTLLLTTSTRGQLSGIASGFCTLLFVSFGSLLLPGLAATDPVAAWTTPGTAESSHALMELAPVILMALIYQNIVPTITRLLDYNRGHTFAALSLGSFIPLVMYLAWCVACLGGGIALDQVGMQGSGLAVFSLATLAGSSIGCSLSCASELDTFWKSTSDEPVTEAATNKDSDTNEPEEGGFKLASVLTTVSLPLTLAWAVTTFGDGDLTSALKVAGGLGSPLLYGILPAWMAWQQGQSQETTNALPNRSPIPTVPLAFLGGSAAGLFGTELMGHAQHLMDTLAVATSTGTL